MSYFRVRCKAPPPPPFSPDLPRINGTLPSIHDCTVELVDDAGNAHELDAVTSIAFAVDAPHVARLVITTLAVELDVEVDERAVLVDGKEAHHG